VSPPGFAELHAKIVQLKMRSMDGKSFATDTADTETLLRIEQRKRIEVERQPSLFPDPEDD
jgi:hypothetical protein